MNFFRSKHDFAKNIVHIQTLSAKIEKKLSKSNVSEDDQIDTLTLEELQDINKIADLANFMLFKYEDKKETQLILQNFVSIIRGSIQSIECIDDEISELILSAEDSIKKVKNMHSKISEKSDLEKSYLDKFIDDKPETSSINLTNFTTVINTTEYQQNSQGNAVPVI